MSGRTGDGTYWQRWFLLLWAVSAAYLIWYKWSAIYWFALSDTDDNMRFAQVRALLEGQGWYDLRQHRMNPPIGASIHWSRLVDLPIAGLMLLIQPFAGAAQAARWSCAIAPLLAFGAGLYGLMLTVRRLVGKWAFFLAVPIVMAANTTMTMWMPLRVDHHGWQLASLIVTVAGMADARRARGGLTAGLATAFSLTIGLELLPYLAVTGALIALWWMIDGEQADRLRAYGAGLAAGTAFGYVVFGSFDNEQPLCDALTPVYLSTLVLTGGLVVALGSLPAMRRWVRIAAALAVAGIVCAFYAHTWPQCLGRPEHISPELDRLWFSHIREAKPLYEHGWRVAFPTLALSLVGLIGAVVMLWRERKGALAMPWLLVSLLSLFAVLLLLWQTRAGPASQLLGAVGATAIGWKLMSGAMAHRSALVRVPGALAGFLFASGLFASLIVQNLPEKISPYRHKVDLANRRCPTLPAMKPIAALPPATILTFTDLGPRLIAVTPHSAIAGPYHRNGDAILDVQHAFRATDPQVAHDVMRRHGATLLLLCPGMSESTVYASEAPGGFYVQLNKGQVPAWLSPVTLPANSPFKLWRLVG